MDKARGQRGQTRDESDVPTLPDIIVTSDFDALIRRIADDFLEAFRSSVAERGVFNVALAGGSTPRPLYQTLARPEISEQFDWGVAKIFFGDERCVPPDHADSNYRMAYESLLGRAPIPSERIYRMPAEREDLEGAAAEYALLLGEHLQRNAEGVPGFDLVLLGVGGDGHVASLFPGGRAIGLSDRWVTPEEAPSSGQKRLTVTLPVIRASRRVWLLCRGEEKAGVLAAAAPEILAEAECVLPVSMARPEIGECRWYLDESAASMLAPEVLGALKFERPKPALERGKGI